MAHCGNCGAEVPKEAVFCGSCGAKTPQARPGSSHALLKYNRVDSRATEFEQSRVIPPSPPDVHIRIEAPTTYVYMPVAGSPTVPQRRSGLAIAGGIIGIIAGIFGFVAAGATLLVGGLGSAFKADSASTIVGLGWGGVVFSFLVLVFGAVGIVKGKVGGVGLIISALLGAILGGTLVAVCMVLALLGGILCAIGARSQTTSMVMEQKRSQRGTSRVLLWCSIGAAGIFLLLLLGAAVSYSKRSSIAGTAKSEMQTDLANAQAIDVKPGGELAMFAFGSNYTEVQRENMLKALEGKVVDWTLPVYEVSTENAGYKVQTAGDGTIGTFIHLEPKSQEERSYIESLKTGSVIHVKGKIDGEFMRNLNIRPAVLVTNNTRPISIGVVTESSQLSTPQVTPSAPEVPSTTANGSSPATVTPTTSARDRFTGKVANVDLNNGIVEFERETFNERVVCRFDTSMVKQFASVRVGQQLSVLGITEFTTLREGSEQQSGLFEKRITNCAPE